MRDCLPMVARLVRSRMTARAVTDLPEPDSPTRAMVSPLCNWKETSRTPSTMPPSTLKFTPILRASRISGRAMGAEIVAFGRSEGLGHQ